MEFTANKYIVPKIKYKMDNKRLLIIVDGQYDFINGSLAVNGAKEKMDELSTFIDTMKRDYSAIVLTADWHPKNHCSFKENGGIWPPHCVEFTHGASIYQPIMGALEGVDYKVLTKGTNKEEEEYSVFKNIVSKTHLERLANMGYDTVDFVGIAYDYCVKESAIDSKEIFTNSKIRVLKDFCPCIGDIEETTKILENNNIEVI